MILSHYQKWKMILMPHVDVEEMRKELLGDLKPILVSKNTIP
jgi:hypothetical protein